MRKDGLEPLKDPHAALVGLTIIPSRWEFNCHFLFRVKEKVRGAAPWLRIDAGLSGLNPQNNRRQTVESQPGRSLTRFVLQT